METNHNISGYHLDRNQSEFVVKVLNQSSSRFHLLIAPAGSGKTTVSCVIASETIRLGAKRILILVPARTLMDQYKYILSNSVRGIKIVSLDRKIIREFESSNKREAFWTDVIVLATLQMIALNEEIREDIFSVPWDLIIIDDMASFPKSDSRIGFMVNSMLQKRIARQFLILSDPNQRIDSSGDITEIFDNAILSQLEVTKWSNKDVFAINEANRNLKIALVNYERSKEELNFIEKYTRLFKRLSKRKLEGEIRSRLLSSSLYAANESLRGLRNRLVHGDLSSLLSIEDNENEFIKDEELLGDANSSNFDINLSNEELISLIKECEDALDYLDKTQTDSKLNALQELFTNKKLGESRTWVYALYLSTISYLYISLSDKFSNIYEISSRTEYGFNAEALRTFRSNGGTLVASAHFLRGLDLPISNIVLYDVPKNKELIYVILSRALSPRMSNNYDDGVNIFILNDISDAIDSESKRIQDFQKIVEQILLGEE
jgi:hypothetical protein